MTCLGGVVVSPSSLINTSVDDCRGSLRCLVANYPAEALELASNTLQLMDDLGIEQKSRRVVLVSVKRQALRELR